MKKNRKSKKSITIQMLISLFVPSLYTAKFKLCNYGLGNICKLIIFLLKGRTLIIIMKGRVSNIALFAKGGKPSLIKFIAPNFNLYPFLSGVA